MLSIDGGWSPPWERAEFGEAALELGDFEGHPFRGNQWQGGGGTRVGDFTPTLKSPEEAYGAWTYYGEQAPMRYAAEILTGAGHRGWYGNPDVSTGPQVIAALESGTKTGTEFIDRRAQSAVDDAATLLHAIDNSEPTTLTLYRGLTFDKNEPDALGRDIVNAQQGDILRIGLESFSADRTLAGSFAKEATIITVGPVKAYAAPEGFETQAEIDGKWTTIPTEHVVSGNFKVVQTDTDRNGGRLIYVQATKSVTAALIEFGDSPGHPFRGNQWTDGVGEAPPTKGDADYEAWRSELMQPVFAKLGITDPEKQATLLAHSYKGADDRVMSQSVFSAMYQAEREPYREYLQKRIDAANAKDSFSAKPVMTEAEAKALGPVDPLVDVPLYHGTSAGGVIREEGFKVGMNSNNLSLDGRGVYLTENRESATEWGDPLRVRAVIDPGQVSRALFVKDPDPQLEAVVNAAGIGTRQSQDALLTQITAMENGKQAGMIGGTVVVYNPKRAVVIEDDPAVAAALELGDYEGHPFRGNQWTGGQANDDPVHDIGVGVLVSDRDLVKAYVAGMHNENDQIIPALRDVIERTGVSTPVLWSGGERYPGAVVESWTTDRSVAERFASESAEPNTVYTLPAGATKGIDVNAALGEVRDWGDEKEWVVITPDTPQRVELGDLPGHPFRGNQWVDGEGVDVTGLKYGGHDTEKNLADDKRIQTGVSIKLTGLHVADHRGADIEKNGFSDPMQSGGKAGAGTYFHIAGDRTGDYAHFMRAGSTRGSDSDNGRQFAAEITLKNPVVIRVDSDLDRPDLLEALAEARGTSIGEASKAVREIMGPDETTMSRVSDRAISQLFQEAGHDGLLILKESVGNGFGSMAVVYDTSSIDVKDVKPLGKGIDKTLAAALELGDYEGHPFRGNQWTDTVGEGGKPETKLDVEKFIAEHPRKDGEEIFEWQGRVVADLPPQQQSDVLFHIREEYQPVPAVREGINRWMEMQGLPPLREDIANTPVDLEEGDAVARYFEKATDQSDDPKVIAAYEDFKRQSAAQWDFMTKPESEGGMGIHVTFTDKVNPYATAADQARDLRENSNITIERGLGGAHEATMTQDEYDQFRAVHDVFGHAGIGSGFDRHGEYQAWLVHASMYSGAGRDAMSTEYHGVNSAAWSGAKGTPGTGKSILLPEKWSNPPWDRESVAASAAKSDAARIADALGLDSDFARRFDKLPWHPLPESERIEFGDFEGHPFRGNQWTTGQGETQVGRTGETNRQIINRLVKDADYARWPKSSRPDVARVVGQLSKLRAEHPSIQPNVTTGGPDNIANRRGAIAVSYLTENTGLEISINSSRMSKAEFEDLKTTEIFGPATRSPEGLATHEWTHTAVAQLSHDGEFGPNAGEWRDAPPEYTTGKVWSVDPDVVLRAFREDTMTARSWASMAGEVSRYATANQVEFMAEAYTSGKLDPDAPDVAKAFSGWLDQRINQHDLVQRAESRIAASIDGGWAPPWERVELGDLEGHPFRGNQWTDAISDLDVYKGRERFNVATMSAFPKDIQDKIVAKLDNMLHVSLAEGQRNIDGLLERAQGTKLWDDGKSWYQGAHDAAIEIATDTGIDRESVIGAYAAMSPGSVWTYETPIVASMAEYVANDQRVDLSDESLALLNFKLDADGSDVRVENGDRISDLEGRDAVFAMRAQYKDDGGEGWGVGFGYDGFEKAVEILRGNVSPDEGLDGVKVRSFYNNIARPDDNDDATIDVHMVQAYANDVEKRNDSSVMGAPAYNTVGIGPTPAVADALRDAAERYGITTNQAQAIAWLEWKAEHPWSDARKPEDAAA